MRTDAVEKRDETYHTWFMVHDMQGKVYRAWKAQYPALVFLQLLANAYKAGFGDGYEHAEMSYRNKVDE
jgi:hypothetical protein